MTHTIRVLLFAATATAVGCSSQIEAGGEGADAGVDDDPLAIPEGPTDGSLDQIHEEIFAQRCSGVPGLCHAGQFEPNLSTPAMAYNYLVNRPSIEKNRALRVAPGAPGTSVLIDKLRGRDVATRMPLGAEPLSDAEIEMIENWIDDGALRRPGADPAPVLNNTPSAPELAVYDGGTRLDLAGPFTVSAGTPLIFRHSVNDFETPDDEIPFALIIVSNQQGMELILRPGEPNGNQGPTVYDAAGPEGAGDTLNYRFDWTVPAAVDLRNPQTEEITTGVPTSGMTLNHIAVYIDEDFTSDDIMVGFTIEPMAMTVE
jgi:hypothetical protein